ncbi:MAG TPA: hypothetical protein VGO63_02155 [Candidatus Paceibacterota bacterium]|jgi:hypothetical protein|nr:hypothetical protein [Candidatus Paceibacterota bacterium]
MFEKLQTKKNEQEVREADFQKNINQILKDIHYKYLSKIADMEYENKFAYDFAGMLAALSRDSKQSFKDIDNEKFAELLKKNDIKRVAEVGPGSDKSSMVLPLKPAFDSAGSELYVIQPLLDYTQDKFEAKGINVINKSAGRLENAKLNLDIIIAHRVFSIGGQAIAVNIEDCKNNIKKVTHSVLDLIHQFSDNPNALMVLFGGSIMVLDRSEIEKEAEVLCWKSFDNETDSMLKDSIRDMDELYLEKIYDNAPNFIVLKKKQKS